MATLLDYIAWRGDLPFSVVPFNEIDALIFCQISYLSFDGIVSESFKTQHLLSDVAEQFFSAKDFSRRSDTGVMINKLSLQLLRDAGVSARFGKSAVCAYRTQFDYQKEEQFCAVTFLPEKKYAFVAFRGTDDTIVGWKEDFNMGVLDTVPAQEDALIYLTEAMSSLHKKFRIGGHSKGGNLAIYAAATVAQKYKRRIADIYNNDGPGFREETLALPAFQKIEKRIHSFYPQFSIVGMLFSRAGAYTVVESEQSGIMQHDPFSWHLTGTGFVALSGFDEASEQFHVTFNTWFKQLPDDERSKFVETLFKLLQATDARTNSEIEKNWLRSSTKIISALAKLDNESRDNMVKTLQLLFKTAQMNMSFVTLFSADKKKRKVQQREK